MVLADLFAATTYPQGFVIDGQPDHMTEEAWAEASLDTLRSMDRMYSENAEGPSPATGRTLHFWGQFTSELPKAFQPDGPNGHQYLRTSSGEAAEERTLALRRAIAKRWPNAKEWAGEGWYRWMIPDGRQMTLKFE